MRLTTLTRPKFDIACYDREVDIVCRSLADHSVWDPKLGEALAWAKQSVRKEQRPFSAKNVLDLGANVGYFGLLAAAQGHHAYMFEPLVRASRKCILAPTIPLALTLSSQAMRQCVLCEVRFLRARCLVELDVPGCLPVHLGTSICSWSVAAICGRKCDLKAMRMVVRTHRENVLMNHIGC